MNNNIRGNNNNRRRGRGNNRSQGGSQLNRIDSRARGNAPQMLEKYRKLAQDASLNGDRVQAEYYLQFADHYFRVIADSRSPKDEMRPRRDNERGQDSAGDGGEDDFRRRDDRFDDDRFGDDSDTAESSGNNDYPPTGNPFTRDNRGERGDRPDRPERAERPERVVRSENADRPERAERPENADRPERLERPERGDPNRRELRRPRKPRDNASEDDSAPVLDPSILPPAIGVGANESDATETAEVPKPRRRTRRPRTDGDEGGEALEQVG